VCGRVVIRNPHLRISYQSNKDAHLAAVGALFDAITGIFPENARD
jgi:hypothetical protein